MGRIFSGELTDTRRRRTLNALIRPRRHDLITIILIAAAMAMPSVVQSATAEEPPQLAPAKYRHVVQACAVEASRFCSLNGRSSNLGRDQTYCLKPHRSDLSLPCRGAVNTALK